MSLEVLDQLESRIGTPLVERTTRRLALTDAGRALHERSHLILNQVDDALVTATGVLLLTLHHLVCDGWSMGLLERELGPRGVLRITRNPVMWGIGLWAVAHMVPNGDWASLLFFGTLMWRLAIYATGRRLID